MFTNHRKEEAPDKRIPDTQLKDIATDAWQKYCIDHANSTDKANYEHLVHQIMERIDLNPDLFQFYCQNSPPLAVDLVCLMADEKGETFTPEYPDKLEMRLNCVTKMLANPQWFDWHHNDFQNAVGQLVLLIMIQQKKQKLEPVIEVVEHYTRLVMKYHPFDNLCQWLYQIYQVLTLTEFCALMTKLTPDHRLMMKFFCHQKIEDKKIWTAFFHQLDLAKLEAFFYQLVFIGTMTNQHKSISQHYVTAIQAKTPSNLEAQWLNLLDKCLQSFVPAPAKWQWAQSFLGALERQSPLKNDTLSKLASLLADLSPTTREAILLASRFCHLIAKSCANNLDVLNPSTTNESDLAWFIAKDFQTIDHFLEPPPSYFEMFSFSREKDRPLARLLNALALDSQADLLIEHWLKQAVYDEPQFIHLVNNLERLDNEASRILLTGIKTRLSLAQEEPIQSLPLHSQQLTVYLTPECILLDIMSNQYPIRLLNQALFWRQHINDLLNISTESALLRLLYLIPRSVPDLEVIWQQAIQNETAAWLFCQVSKHDDEIATHCLLWWQRRAAHTQISLLKSMRPILIDTPLPVTTLTKLSELIRTVNGETTLIQAVMEAWIGNCLKALSSEQNPQPHQIRKLLKSFLKTFDFLTNQTRIELPFYHQPDLGKLLPQLVMQADQPDRLDAFLLTNANLLSNSSLTSDIQASNALNRLINQQNEHQITDEQCVTFFLALSKEKQATFLDRHLTDRFWVCRRFDFLHQLGQSVNISLAIFEQIKQKDDPWPYLALLWLMPEAWGFTSFKLPQQEQMFHHINQPTDLIRILQRPPPHSMIGQLFDTFWQYLHQRKQLTPFIMQSNMDLPLYLQLLNHSRFDGLGDLFLTNKTLFTFLQPWFGHPDPFIDIHPQSQLMRLVTLSFTDSIFDCLPDLSILEKVNADHAMTILHALWHWQRRFQFFDHFPLIFKSDNPDLMTALLALKWLNQLPLVSNGLLPILRERQARESKPGAKWGESEPCQTFLTNLSAIESPGHGEINTLFHLMLTKLETLLETIQQQLPSGQPLSMTLTNSLRQQRQFSQIDRQRLPPHLFYVIHQLESFEVSASGTIEVPSSIESGSPPRISETDSFFDKKWQQIWLGQVITTLKNGLIADSPPIWVEKDLFPAICQKDNWSDCQALLSPLNLSTLWRIYLNSQQHSAQIKIARPLWHACCKTRTLTDTIKLIYQQSSSTLSAWTEIAQQQHCFASAAIFGFLSRAKESHLVLNQIERLLTPIDAINAQIMSWLQQECLQLIEKAADQQSDICEIVQIRMNQIDNKSDLIDFSTQLSLENVPAETIDALSPKAALAILMDEKHLMMMTDEQFLVLANKTRLWHEHLIGACLQAVGKQVGSHWRNRLRQWYQLNHNKLTHAITKQPDEQQRFIWLNLVDATPADYLDNAPLSGLTRTDNRFWLAILERVARERRCEGLRLIAVARLKVDQVIPLLQSYPQLIGFFLALSQNERFQSEHFNWLAMTKAVFIEQALPDWQQDGILKLILPQANPDVLAMLLAYNTGKVISYLLQQDTFANVSQRLQQTLDKLDHTCTDQAALAKLIRQLDLEASIETMSGPCLSIRIWLKRTWHQLWTGNSPFLNVDSQQNRFSIPPSDKLSGQMQLPVPFASYSKPNALTKPEQQALPGHALANVLDTHAIEKMVENSYLNEQPAKGEPEISLQNTFFWCRNASDNSPSGFTHSRDYEL